MGSGRVHGAIGIALAASAAACGTSTDTDPPPSPPKASIAIFSGDHQEVTAGDTLPARPTVRVFDSGGPRVGVAVTFTSRMGSTTARVGEVATDAQGLASVRWDVGGVAGRWTLLATIVTRDSAVFAATVRPGRPYRARECCDIQHYATVGAPVTTATRVVVVDSFSNPVPGRTVRFKLESGGGSIVGPIQVTGPDGVASLGGWTLGPTAPVNRVSARVDSGPSVMITKLGAPDSIALIAGDNQTVNVGTYVKVPPAVRVFGPGGRRLGAGFSVVFDGRTPRQVVDGNVSTDPSGTARVRSWRIGPDTGSNEISARSFDHQLVITAFGRRRGAARILPLRGDGLSVFTGNFVPQRPQFRLIDSTGEPIGYQRLTVLNPSGGTLTMVAETDGNGLGVVSSWRLGPAQGLQVLEVSENGRTLGRMRATALPVPSPSRFDIHVRFRDTLLAAPHRKAFTDAALQWTSAIVGDLEDIPVVLPEDEGGCFPALDETVDDLLVYVVADSIDGPGEVLAGAGPCAIRASNLLPIIGLVIVDTADVGSLDLFALGRVALHELGHTLGFGGLWPTFDLLHFDPDQGPRFVGLAATVAMTGAGRAKDGYPSSVPVDADGGPGTRLVHWSTQLGPELMTGYLGEINALSAITINSMRDLGYVVNDVVAEPYPAPFQFSRARPARSFREMAPRRPVYVVDRGGVLMGSLNR